MNLDTFSDPAVPKDPIPGDPIPVSLITLPFAKELANVATGGAFTFDQKMNPLDLFHTFHSTSAYGVAVLIMNSLTTPLTLVESSHEGLDDYDNGPQLGYPAVIDSGTQSTVNAHQIPGVRHYPRQSLHKMANGSPALIGGIGLYRFAASTSTSAAIAKRGLAFACSEDASITSTPLLGVAFDYWSDAKGSRILSVVSADLSTQKKGDTQSNLSSLLASAISTSPPGPYDVGSGSNKMTIWGVVAPGTPVYEPNMMTLVVWVRDVSSTFG